MSQYNPIKLKKNVQINTWKTGNYMESSRRRKHRSTKEKGKVDLKRKRSNSNTSKVWIIQRIMMMRTCRKKLCTVRDLWTLSYLKLTEIAWLVNLAGTWTPGDAAFRYIVERSKCSDTARRLRSKSHTTRRSLASEN